MLYVKVLCDENFDENLTYVLEGEEVVGKYGINECEKCAKYSECQGWAKEFNRCEFTE